MRGRYPAYYKRKQKHNMYLFGLSHSQSQSLVFYKYHQRRGASLCTHLTCRQLPALRCAAATCLPPLQAGWERLAVLDVT